VHCVTPAKFFIVVEPHMRKEFSLATRRRAPVPYWGYLAPAIEQIEERLGQTPNQLVVDAGYTSRENILAAHEKDVELIGPWVETDGRVQQRFARVGVTDAFLPDKFQYDPASDTYTCPEGKHLTARDGHDRPGRRLVRYQAVLLGQSHLRAFDCRHA
jgi:hypothetical protein